MRPDDALKYAYARMRATAEWTLDSIGGSMCDHHSGHEDELNAIGDCVGLVRDLLVPFGNPNLYSDGRRVRSSTVIDDESGLFTSHVWYPDASIEEPRSWRGTLSSGDPDIPSPGIFEVSTDPSTQQIHTRVIRIAGGAS